MSDLNEKEGVEQVPHFEGSQPVGKQLTGKSFVPVRAYDLAEVADAHGFHEHTGLVVDIDEARREFGDEIASKLKLDKDGHTILWPQPTDRPDDPQNWPESKKALQLLVLTMAAFVPDFISSCGIASLFPLAAQFGTTTGQINNLTSNWSIFMLGWGGILWIFLIKKFGRLPCIFWGQLIGLGMTIGCTFAPTLHAFAAFRILAATFQTAPQVSGLYTICDMYPFHRQARMLSLWSFGYILSPFIGPAVLGFIGGAGITWRWIYGTGAIYCAVVVLLITFCAEETMFDRYSRPIPKTDSTGSRNRVETLLGITGWKLRHQRPSWKKCVGDVFEVVWKPQVALALIYVMWVFGFGIGINVTNAVFVGSPPPLGYGLTLNQQAGSYWSPIVGCIIGEIVGRYFNDFVAKRGIKRNHGVFEPEMRLWTLYLAMPLFVAGMLLLGYSFQYKLNFAACAIGWVLAEISILVTTVAVLAYLNNVEPYRQGEMSALTNHARILGGFAVPFFQIEWAVEQGAHVTFGVEAAVVAGLFVVIVPLLQWKGRAMRTKFPASTR